MNQQWQEFLLEMGAEMGEGERVSFKGAERFPTCALFDLSHYSLFQVSGDDAETFLQGQLTNDVAQVTDHHWQMAAFCTPKGRMLAAFALLRRGEDYLIQLPSDNGEPLKKRLPMFILRSKVKMQDVSDELVRFGIAGQCAEEQLSRLLPELPMKQGDSTSHDGVVALRLHGLTPRFEFIGEFEPIAALWRSLASNATVSTREHWSLLDIQAGTPTIYSATREAFVPQMANMDLIDGVSFNKGCYTGQEVVARMKYLGKMKRRMYRMRAAGETSIPTPGAPLFSASGEASAQGAGMVVDAQHAPDGALELLVVAEIARVEANDLRLEGPDGPRLERIDLPYAMPEAA